MWFGASSYRIEGQMESMTGAELAAAVTAPRQSQLGELYIWCRLAPIHVGRDRVAMRTFRKTNNFVILKFRS